MKVELELARPNHGRPRQFRGLGATIRLPVAVILGAIEMMATSFLFVFDAPLPIWQHPVYWIRQAVLLVIFSGVAWVVLGWTKRNELAEMWYGAEADSGWRNALLANLAIFSALTAATVSFTAGAAPLTSFPWGWFALYCIPLAATAISLVLLAAPYRFWRDLISHQRAEIAVAVSAGAIILLLGGLTRQGWGLLSGLTLEIVAHLLAFFGQEVLVDYPIRLVAIGDFGVTIDDSCSGYEGMGLVTAFLALFLWAFRSTMRFPHALLLLPIGLVAILALNVARIAALVALGAHVSPAMAVNGFHSQAGWMSFLAVTIAIMTLAPRVRFFTTATPVHRRPLDESDQLIQAYIVPFMALMAGSIAASALAPYDTWLYGLKVLLAGAALWIFLDAYRPILTKLDPLSLGVGLAVGAAWIATDPGAASSSTGSSGGIGAWIASQSLWMATIWLVIRAVGSVLVVPVVEELAFRGLLYRWIISRRFETVPLDRFSWLALTISSTMFGLLHSRPIAGALAGAVFALVMIRRGHLMDAIAAHMAANAAIMLWAVTAGQWSLL